MKKSKKLIGWEEWCALPNLGIPAIKAKIDTGAKTSSLYAFDIEPFTKDGHKHVSFQIHPIQRNKKIAITCSARLVDYRYITSSTGQKEKRYVIQTVIELNLKKCHIELTLAKRDTMAFRMLLGREALRTCELNVDPSKSCLLGKLDKLHIKTLYTNPLYACMSQLRSH